MSSIKQELGFEAARLVKNGQVVGLGTGSTSTFAIYELGRRIREEGLQIHCVATSYDTAFLAAKEGLICLPIETVSQIDISVDSADEIDPCYYLLKGGGGAHTREKLVHTMSERFVVIAEASKKVTQLGHRFPVPIEIIPAAMSFVMKQLESLGALQMQLRSSLGKCGPITSDNNNWIIDARFNIDDPSYLEETINAIPGVLENGIFGKIHPHANDCFIK